MKTKQITVYKLNEVFLQWKRSKLQYMNYEQNPVKKRAFCL